MWDYTIKHVIWLKNRVPITALLYKDKDINITTSITPYKAFTSNYPDFNKLQVFSYKAIPYKININHLTTFEPRIRDKTWIFIGIEGNSIWKVLNIEILAIAKTINA